TYTLALFLVYTMQWKFSFRRSTKTPASKFPPMALGIMQRWSLLTTPGAEQPIAARFSICNPRENSKVFTALTDILTHASKDCAGVWLTENSSTTSPLILPRINRVKV